MIDYGYSQAEVCWGDAYMDAANVTKVCVGIQAAGGSRIRMAIQLGSLADTDRAINIACQHGLKPLPVLINNPTFGYDGSVAGFATMCKTLALRYGPSGTNQVSEYELFNEPNSSLNAPGGAVPASFVQYLQAGYNAIKSVHTSSTVIAGGTIPSPDVAIPFIGGAITPLEWYTGIYNASGGKYFDAAGFHWYFEQFPTTTDYHYTFLTGVRSIMNANGDTAKKIWITETGVGIPYNTTDPTVARDWLKFMVDAINAGVGGPLGPFFIYNYRNSTTNTNDPNSVFGIVNYDYSPKSPIYEYALTINQGSAAPSPPTPPSGVTVSDITATSAVVSFTPGASTIGISGSRVYLADGTKVADTASASAEIDGMAAGTPYQVYVTSVDTSGVEGAHSALTGFTTNAPSGGGVQNFFSYTFTGSTTPAVFTQLGLGFTVSGGVALPNSPTMDGVYYTVSPFNQDQASPDHSCAIQQNIASAYSDRAALARVRVKPDGTQWMGAAVFGNGQADACQLIMFTGGTVQEVVDAADAAPLAPTDILRLSAQGNVYTVYRVTNNAASVLLSWTDVYNIYSGSTNRRTGIGWIHKQVGGVYYPPPGITGTFKGTDLTPIQAAGGISDVWQLVVADENDWDLVISADLWEATL